ncbi:TetR/AcrR family transcriptional regulator [Pseudonocardia sp. KRD291]|uniref:TetR/AcrR family transcriptional regulator n=1 Tax=Pseudonocardia sp. KRD291 TaxID=2792007 RepID=UPI001C49D72A|nr:TetR/AcrR family transcriptional regulator [Pseudonocardia sp. KRD291]MBW0103305.1 TetR/AcrR family transcriptional regulator [Pseudonocardia sp. KRD291]
MSADTEQAGGPRPLRADAARNHRRIVTAAAEAFEELGADVALEEIAHRAGLGVATLYRRFRTREQLVRAVFEDIFAAEIEPTVAVAAGEPWADLVGTLTRTVDALAGHRVILGLARETAALDVATVQRFGRDLERLLDRARDAGVVRPELTVRDLAAVMVMALATVHASDPSGDDRRRYLALLVDGLRPGNRALPTVGTCPSRP